MGEDRARTADGALVFRASRRKWSGVLAVCAAFVTGGLLLALTGESAVIGWISIVLFGAGVLVSVWQLSAPSRLIVSRTTIEVSYMGRRWTRDLDRCGPFDVWRNPFARQSLVVFDHPDDAAHRLGGMGRGLSGHSSALPDTFGKTAGELAKILNEARATAQS